MTNKLQGTIKVIPYPVSGMSRKPYMVSQAKADILVARGHARWAGDGTRKLYEMRASARGIPRVWRKTPSVDVAPDGTRYSVSVMQLVPDRG